MVNNDITVVPDKIHKFEAEYPIWLLRGIPSENYDLTFTLLILTMPYSNSDYRSSYDWRILLA
jgi:hypothetical protein